MVERPRYGRIGIGAVGVLLAAALAIALYWAVPVLTDIGAVEVTLGLLVFLLGAMFALRLAGRVVSRYNVAEVTVDDVITRDGSGGLGARPGAVSSEDIVEQIERADEDSAAEALIVRLNTPGGAVVPSEDIRTAVASFDGPTVAYAEDMAASGGFWIASGADEFHARRGAVVGSIGVNGTQFGLADFAEKAGIDYRRFVAGEYKDTPSSWRELSEDERAYFQGLLDEYYEQFVETVVDGRDLDAEMVRETEARIYLGETATEMGLVDTCGPKEEMEDRLAERIGAEEVSVAAFEPEHGLRDRISLGVQASARAFGAGLASALVADEDPPVRV